MLPGDPRDVSESDIAFAWNVQQLLDVILGRRSTQVRLTRWSHPTEPALKVANRNAAGPIMELLDWNNGTPITVMKVDKTGVRQTSVNGYFDFKFQATAPLAPGAGTGTIRFYARGGQFYFKSEDSGEQQIPIGAPPGPMVRFAAWMS